MSAARSRSVLVGLCVVLALMGGAFVYRVISLQVSPSEKLSNYVGVREGLIRSQGLRGEIRDRRGRVLASTRFGWRVFVDPVRLEQPFDGHVRPLARAIGIEPGEVGMRIAEAVSFNDRAGETGGATRRYVRLGGTITPGAASAVRALELKGVHLERVPVRVYPTEAITAALVGKVGSEHEGLLGVEHRADGSLHGQDGSLRYVRDHEGRPLWVRPGGLEPTLRGEDVWLSIDVEVQRIAIEELERGIADADAAGGRVVVVEPVTGDILAMADLQTKRTDVETFPWVLTEEWDERRGDKAPGRKRYDAVPFDERRETHPAMARNRCVEDIYEPGSTFKPFIWAVALEEGVFEPDDIVQTHDGEWRTPYGRLIPDTEPLKQQTWTEVLINSSNIGMVQAGMGLSKEQLRSAVTRYGFGRRTGVPLPGEASGLVTPMSRWNDYTHTSVSFGQEVAVTPVQMARAFSVFARPGKLAGTLPSANLLLPEPGDGAGRSLERRVLRPETVAAVRVGLEGVGQKVDRRMRRWGEGPFSYRMFGKSGTAEIPLGKAPDGHRRPAWIGGYYDDQYNTSFVGAAPASDPRLVVLVVIDDPGPGVIARRMHYGSSTAGPVVRRIIERVLSYQGVEPDVEQDEARAVAGR